jgi:hypothetical protein
MNLYFLDAGGAGLFYYFILLGVLFIILATLLEAVVMIVMKYNLPFKKAFGDSLFANLFSLIVGFLLIFLGADLLDNNSWVNLLILYVITVVLEVFVLYQRNRKKPFVQTLTVCVVMNLVSYLVLFLFTLLE